MSLLVLNLDWACRPTVALLEDRVLRFRSTPGPLLGAGSGGGSGRGKDGIEGAGANLRGPPGTVGVGAASRSSLKKVLENSMCQGCALVDGLCP